MGAGGEGLSEGVVAVLVVDQPLEQRPAGHAFFLELVGKRDALAVVVECHEHGHVLLLSANAHLYAVDQAIQDVRRLQFAVDHLVAHACP